MLKTFFHNLLINPALANDKSRTYTLESPLGAKDIPELLSAIAKYLVIIGGPLATVIIIFGAYQMLTAGGNPEKYETGKKTIFYAVIGLVVILVGSGILAILAPGK